MYRSNLDRTDKGGAAIAVVAIHVGLLLLLLNLSGKLGVTGAQSVLRVFDISAVLPPPPPPPPPPPQQRTSAKPKQTKGGSTPANIRSQATPVVAPTPRILLPVPTPVAAAKTPAQGTAPTQVASSVAGPGTGAGGFGNGNGNGNGAGSGDGDGGVADPPHLASPVLTGRDLPRDLLDQWPTGVPVFIRLRVSAQGFVSECNVLRGTGNPSIDATMCNIAHDRLRFRPAVNRSGQAVAGWFGYAQRPPR